MKKFSVVIPLYNKSYSIEKCINSVLSQTHTDYEIIIVNDGSKDNSLSIVKSSFKGEIDDGTIIVINQKNQGVSVARNIGVEASNFDYICFLDADDEWKPDFLQNIKRLINEYPSACLYCLQHETKLDNQLPVRNTSFYKDGFIGYVDNFFKASLFGSIANSSKVCIRKHSLLEVGGFPENQKSGEDLFVWIELQKLSRVAFFNKVSVVIHTTEDLSRKGRDLSIPYPLIHYSMPENRRNLGFWLKLYLRKVYLAHIISSHRKDDYEAILVRSQAAQQLFPISSKIFSSIANYKINKS